MDLMKFNTHWSLALASLACAAIGALVSTALHFTIFNQKTDTSIAVVDTQRVIDAQKLYWIRAMNATNNRPAQATHAEILKESAAFPQKLTQTLAAQLIARCLTTQKRFSSVCH